MNRKRFLTMSQIAKQLGSTSRKVGQVLKDEGYRLPDGEPSPLAFSQGMVEKRSFQDRPFVIYWAWHKTKTKKVLASAGLGPVGC
jgi:hypothetical protein